MAKSKKEVWIIGSCNSDATWVNTSLFVGTEFQVKREIVKMLKEVRAINNDEYDYGTETVADVEESKYGLYGFTVFSYCHIDVTARRLQDMQDEYAKTQEESR